MTDPRVFFQIAAALIPALALGGLLSEKLRPPENWELPEARRKALGAAAVVAGTCVFAAEIAAVQAGLTGSPNALETWLVAGVVVAASGITVAVVVSPWVGPYLIGGDASRLLVPK